jgi:chaperonin cofactor prefoldin
MAAATLEQRVTSLERRMSEMEGQLGFLLPTLRQVHLDLLGFKEDVDDRFTSLENDLRRFKEDVDTRFTSLENKVDSLENKVDRMDDKFTRKFSELDAKVDAMPRAVAEIVSGLIKK